MAETELIFAEGSSLPETSTVANALVEAASDPNFALSVDASSVATRGTVFLGSFVFDCQHFSSFRGIPRYGRNKKNLFPF